MRRDWLESMHGHFQCILNRGLSAGSLLRFNHSVQILCARDRGSALGDSKPSNLLSAYLEVCLRVSRKLAYLEGFSIFRHDQTQLGDGVLVKVLLDEVLVVGGRRRVRASEIHEFGAISP